MSKDDEPVFVLRASDDAAVEAVRFWSQHYRRIAQLRGANAGGITDKEKARVKEAMDVYDAMRAWRQARGK